MAVDMEKSPIYSPKQVLAGSFLGGPIALVYFLRTNFKTLGNQSAATQTVIWGSSVQPRRHCRPTRFTKAFPTIPTSFGI
jgi:hypothetical protein